MDRVGLSPRHPPDEGEGEGEGNSITDKSSQQSSRSATRAEILSTPPLEAIGSDIFNYEETNIPSIEEPWIRRGPAEKRSRFSTFRSLYSWYWPTSVKRGAASESKLLSLGGIHSLPVEVNVASEPDKEEYIHTLILDNKSNGKDIVLCHGFGAGLGFFYRNYAALLALPQVGRVLAPDWLGMGRSSRPKFPKFTPHPQWQYHQVRPPWRSPVRLTLSVLGC